MPPGPAVAGGRAGRALGRRSAEGRGFFFALRELLFFSRLSECWGGRSTEGKKVRTHEEPSPRTGVDRHSIEGVLGYA